MTLAYIGLGSNLDDPAAQVRAALTAIACLDGVDVIATSSLYRSPPMGPPGQPDYCNAVCAVESGLSPPALMQALLAIEQQAGRVRGGERWGPRRIDLDLLHVDGVELATAGLRLPHPGIGRRAFVLAPLAEVAPDLVIPGVGAIAGLAAAASADVSTWGA